MSEQTKRATRLGRIVFLLEQYPKGLTVAEISEKVGFSKRTIQRDLAAIESEWRVPLLVQGRRYRIAPGSVVLNPIRFNVQETRALLLAARLIARHSDNSDPDAQNALHKLAEAMPYAAVSREIRSTAEEISAAPVDEQQVEVLRQLTSGWANGKSVAIRYHSIRAGKEVWTGLDPYLIEPAPFGAGIYVIGFSHEHGEVRTFKLDRIVKAAASDDSFEPQELPAIKKRLANSWGVVFDGDEEYDITVDFSPGVARRVAETNWHTSQTLTQLADGGVRFQVRLPSLLEFVPWVRSWGPEACVVSPPELREQVAASLAEAADLYK